MNRRNGPHRIATAFAAVAVLAGVPAGAGASTIIDSVQPIGIIGTATKPDCASPYAPYSKADLLASSTSDDGFGDTRFPGQEDLAFIGLGFDLLPTATICSPTYAGFPGPFSGTAASRLTHSRVGRGWRELGGTLAERAPLRPGDRLIVPEVDDAAQVRAQVAADGSSPAATVSFTDLAPGPSTLTIGRDQRGVVATLTRSDGTTTDAVAAVPVIPALNPSVSGSPTRWKIVTHDLPGSVVFASEFEDDDVSGVGVGTPDGTTTTVLNHVVRGKRRAREFSLIVATSNRAALRFSLTACVVGVNRRQLPVAISCDPLGLSELFDLAYRFADGRGAARRATQWRALPLSGRPSASAARATAPIDVRPVTRATAMLHGDYGGLVPLAADVNGDGLTDFWADTRDYGSFTGLGASAGSIFVSGPSGLQPHRVSLARSASAILGDESSLDSDISAIDDLTGDGVGELIVDLGERQSMIPGDRAWGANTAPISIPDPADLGDDDFLFVPSSSSPGAPYAALDDVTGDGRRELGATDDYGTWQGIASGTIVQGRAQRIAAVARAVPAPSAIVHTREGADTAPRFDPRTRVIAGQALTLTWPTVATLKAPEGKVTISVRDALGRDVVPPATTTVPGNALLLDHDRRSGDSLLLAVTPQCLHSTPRGRISKRCAQTVVRVRADGSIRQTLVLPADLRATAAPQSARFLGDGPDADGDVDVVLTEDGYSVSTLNSTATGAVRPTARTTPAFLTPSRIPSGGLRFIPVVAPDGARHVFVSLDGASNNEYYGPGRDLPAEVAWK